MQQNLFQNIPDEVPKEIFEKLLSGNQFRMERIISDGQASPKDFWYDQPENEWVLLLAGSATLEVETRSGSTQQVDIRQIDLKPGDYLLLPSHQRHRVVSTDKNDKTIWLAIHFE